MNLITRGFGESNIFNIYDDLRLQVENEQEISLQVEDEQTINLTVECENE